MTAAAQLREDARRVATFPRDVATMAVRAFADAVRPRLEADTGGDRELSGSPGRLSVTTRVDGYTLVEGLVAAGPRAYRANWRWLDAGTDPRPQGSGRHPGTPARRTWSDPIDTTAPIVLARVEDMFRVVV